LARHSSRSDWHSWIDHVVHCRGTASSVDLRSDTKTQPDSAMFAAMASATLGDDVANECSTTHQLEAFTADLLGKEAGLLVSSGTQGNLLAIAAQCPRGSEIIVGNPSHIHLWEAGGPSILFSIAQRTVGVDAHGKMSLDNLEAVLNLSLPNDDHCCPTRLVALENTNAERGGAILDADYVDTVAKLCQQRSLFLHIDGARFLNAAAALAVPGDGIKASARKLAAGADTVSVCLSKGLGCPGGAVIVGNSKTIAECRRLRKLVGGSTRQAAGLLAATALHALRERDVLADLLRDHALMQRIVKGLQALPGVQIEHYGGTNIAFVTLVGSSAASRAAEVTSCTEAVGIRLGGPYGKGKLGWRLATHRGISDVHVDCLLDIFSRQLCQDMRQTGMPT